MRAIDADALKEKAWDADTRCGYVQVVDVGDIDDAPTIEPERKTGKWIYPHETTRFVSICSECGAHGRGNFCSNCGADMKGKRGNGEKED